HGDLCRYQREPEDGRGLPAVGLLHAQAVVGQAAAGDLHPALGDPGVAGLPVDPLDAERLLGLSQQRSVDAVRRRRPDLADRSLARPWREHLGDNVEATAVLDGDLPGRPDGYSTGTL